MSNTVIKLNAHSYLASYKVLSKKHYEHSKLLETWYSNYFFPSVTVLTFGIELHFKWILEKPENRITDKIDINTHSLSKLFHYLNKGIKNKIVDKWFIFFKLRGGKVKAGTDKYKFFNTLLKEFHDVYEAMRYVHEDYDEKREAFNFILPVLEPLMFSFTAIDTEYVWFVNNVVNLEVNEYKQRLEDSILKIIIMKQVSISGIKEIDLIKENHEIWEKVKIEEETLQLKNKSTKELAELFYEMIKGENDCFKIMHDF